MLPAFVFLFFGLAAALMFLPTIIGGIWGLLVWMGPANTEMLIGLILLAALVIWAAGKKK